MDQLLNKIRKKKLIFTVTTGRSGTNYLTFLLSLLKGVKSEHEAQPGFHEYFRDIIDEKLSFEEFWISKKLPYIASQVPQQYYADSSHLACKGFFESLIEMGIRPSFIILKRNNRDVAKSLLKLKTIPFRTELGLKYLNSPTDSGVLQLAVNLNELTDYQLCYWYTLEIDRRIDFYIKYFKEQSCPYVFITFEELISGNAIQKIIKELSLPRMSFLNKLRFYKWKSSPRNEKTRSKQPVGTINFDDEEKDLREKILWN